MKNLIAVIFILAILIVFLSFSIKNNTEFYNQTASTIGFLFQREVFAWLLISIILIMLFVFISKALGGS